MGGGGGSMAGIRHAIALPDPMQNLFIYLLGVVIVVGALAYGAYMLHAPPAWIAIGALIVIGFGIMGAVSKTQRPH